MGGSPATRSPRTSAPATCSAARGSGRAPRRPTGFCPFGPWNTNADEVPAPEDLALRTWVNGELGQDARTNDLIFSIVHLLAHIAETCTPEPGALC